MAWNLNDKEKPEQNAIAMTPDMIQGMLATMIREMKKPTEIEQAKLDEDARFIAVKREEMVRIGREEEAQRKATQDACTHKKPNGQWAVGGQRFGDGKVRELCLRCQKWLNVYTPAPESLAGGFGEVSEAF